MAEISAVAPPLERPALVRQATRPRSNGAPAYLAAVGLRTAARAAWGLAVPAALTVTGYGEYQLLATLAAMLVQLGLLGAPQTIVRHAGRDLPLLAVIGHATLLAVLGIAVAGTFLLPARAPLMMSALVALVVVTIWYTLFGARAKARFAFTTSLGGESVAALVLGAAAAWLIWRRAHAAAPTAVLALFVEASAIAGAAIVLVRARATRPTRAEWSGRGARPFLAQTYAVGVLVILDAVVFRRLEVYFLERSPDGLSGVAVLGLSVQLATVLLLIPTALLEVWQPELAIAWSGDRAAYAGVLARRRRQFSMLWLAVAALGSLAPLVLIPIVFPHYVPWLGYICGFVAIRLACAGAGFHSSVLYATGRQRWLMMPAVAGSVVILAANAWFTLRTGLRGALLAYLATQVAVAVLTVAAFRRASRG